MWKMIKDVWNHYWHDPHYKIQVQLTRSFLLHLLFIIYYIICGYLYQSVWFAVLAVYYFLLMMIRGQFLTYFNQSKRDLKKEYQMSLASGVNMLLLTFVVIGIEIFRIYENQIPTYPPYMIYGVALYVFICLVTAVYGAISYRKYRSPAYTSAKAIPIVTSLVGMFSLQVSLLSLYSTDAHFTMLLNRTTGILVLCMTFFISVAIIKKSRTGLRRLD